MINISIGKYSINRGTHISGLLIIWHTPLWITVDAGFPDFSSKESKLFPVLHSNFACAALTYTRQFTDKGYFLPIQSSSNKSHSSLLDLILLLHYLFISLFQSWCPQTVSFFLLSPSGTDASSLPYAINLWPTSEKDIPPFSLTHHFYQSLLLLYIFLFCFGLGLLLVFGVFWFGVYYFSALLFPYYRAIWKSPSDRCHKLNLPLGTGKRLLLPFTTKIKMPAKEWENMQRQ